MNLTKMIAATAAVAVLATSAVAGGLGPIVEDDIITITPPPEPTGGSLPGWVIPAVIVAALIGVASQEDDSGTAADNSDPS